MVCINPTTGQKIVEPDDYYDISVQFYTRSMKRNDAIKFWNFMKSWEWGHDKELFWLQGFDPVTGSVKPVGITIRSYGLGDRIKALFEVLSSLFPGLNASADLKYSASDTLWKMGISNYGGYLRVILSNGKVEIHDLSIR